MARLSRGSRPLRLLALALGAASLLSACSGDDGANLGTKGSDIGDLENFTPPDLLGYKVQKENITTSLEKAERAYVDATVLYSVREVDDLVQATLQISRFSDEADFESGSFRRRVVQRLGGSNPQVIRVGEQDVYLNQSAKQRISAWFNGRHLIVLSVRDDFEQPRNLLRAALEVEP